jgi:hypothetical protein
MRSLDDEILGCIEQSHGFRPGALTVNLVPGQERRVTVAAISPEPPPRVERCVARAIHTATWPTPRADRPLTIHTFRFEHAD